MSKIGWKLVENWSKLVWNWPKIGQNRSKIWFYKCQKLVENWLKIGTKLIKKLVKMDRKFDFL